jgi:hypothetical protein
VAKREREREREKEREREGKRFVSFSIRLEMQNVYKNIEHKKGGSKMLDHRASAQRIKWHKFPALLKAR